MEFVETKGEDAGVEFSLASGTWKYETMAVLPTSKPNSHKARLASMATRIRASFNAFVSAGTHNSGSSRSQPRFIAADPATLSSGSCKQSINRGRAIRAFVLAMAIQESAQSRMFGLGSLSRSRIAGRASDPRHERTNAARCPLIARVRSLASRVNSGIAALERDRKSTRL